MRSTAGIVAGLFFVGIVANCGGDDSGGPGGPKAGSSSAGEGGDGTNTGATSPGGTSSNAGMPSVGGQGGEPTLPTGCTTNAECGSTAKCVDTVCLKNDGQACDTAADCQNNCIDDVCTSGKPDDEDCEIDDDCAHTCIDNVCAPPSPVGGDCDVDLGAGGAGAGGAGGAGPGPLGTAGAGGEGTVVQIPQARDCEAPLQCFAGKCLTPDGEACRDNVDCVNTCVDNICKPKEGLDGSCDDATDCVTDAFVCDATSSKCKLGLKQQCNDNPQCQSNRCLCSNADCSVRACKTATSVCQCRWSQLDSESCDNSSAATLSGSTDPNGCNTDKKCNGAGLCITNAAGDCQQKCQIASNGADGYAGTADDICTSFQTATGCSSGYHGEYTAGGECAAKKTGTTFTDEKGTHYNAVCQATCTCEQNPN